MELLLGYIVDSTLPIGGQRGIWKVYNLVYEFWHELFIPPPIFLGYGKFRFSMILTNSSISLVSLGL